MAQAPPTLYIIDGHAQIFRAYHAIRGLKSPVTGESTNATFGFLSMLIRLLREQKPDHLILVIDAAGDRGTFRSQIYPEYKAQRDPPPEDLHPQVDRIVEICRLWGIPVLSAEEVEADDVIATLCRQAAAHPDLQVRIVSRDKDLQQLLSRQVAMFDPYKDELIDTARLMTEKGIRPDQVVDMLALMGDSADNIRGAEGIGPKTACKLLARYGSIEGLLEHLQDLTPRQQESLRAVRDRLPLNRQLVQLKSDVPVSLDLDQARTPAPPLAQLEPLFRQLGFTRHLEDLKALNRAETPDTPIPPVPPGTPALVPAQDFMPQGLFDTAPPPPAPESRIDRSRYKAVTTRAELKELTETLEKIRRNRSPLSIDCETDRLDPMQAKLVGLCLSWAEGEAVYVPVRSRDPSRHLDEPAVLKALKGFLEDPAIPKVGQNLKYDLLVLRQAGVNVRGVSFDTLVASYLIDATRSSHKLDDLSLALLGHPMIPITDLIGSGRRQRSMIDLPFEQIVEYGAEDADVALRLMHILRPQLEAMGLLPLFETLEMPLVEVLAELEHNGITVDPDELDRQRLEMEKRIAELRLEIEDAAGTPFNPDSPRQLADALFKTLGCQVVRKGKTGPSTDSEVLQKIVDEQEGPGVLVAEKILAYRQLTKLCGTYLVALKEAIHPVTRRIHASFHQTVTATGRLSSSDPNLQNIPVRSDVGRQIRRAFIAPPGHKLLCADYSQIELRLLAHLSEDPALIRAFESGQDIHTAVAAQVFDVPIESVTREQRGVAKMVNFGIVYGITPYGLARRLPTGTAGSNVEVARRIIDDYKRRYPGINAFLDRCVQKAATHGYVETFCGRRRPVPEVRSRNGNLAALGRRIAINTVVQGSAADLIKTAMVDLHRRIAVESRPLKMLLQIHDELVFEVEAGALDEQAAFVRERMENALPLKVPVHVDVSWGDNWLSCKEV